jgi:hypothetical protein
MAPNHAIASRYGASQQKQSFLMSNVVPQTPQLNRGVWRVLEHRIADLWTARYGEIWVVVGCVPSRDGEKIPGTDIDVPSAFYQVIIAQEGLDIRMLATYFPADTQWNAWAARHIVSVDELEEITGLDFNSELPDFIERKLLVHHLLGVIVYSRDYRLVCTVKIARHRLNLQLSELVFNDLLRLAVDGFANLIAVDQQGDLPRKAVALLYKVDGAVAVL